MIVRFKIKNERGFLIFQKWTKKINTDWWRMFLRSSTEILWKPFQVLETLVPPFQTNSSSHWLRFNEALQRRRRDSLSKRQLVERHLEPKWPMRSFRHSFYKWLLFVAIWLILATNNFVCCAEQVRFLILAYCTSSRTIFRALPF